MLGLVLASGTFPPVISSHLAPTVYWVHNFCLIEMKTANEDKDAPNDAQTIADIATKSKEVDSLLFKKCKFQALSISLRNPPAGNKSDSIKVQFNANITFQLIRKNSTTAFLNIPLFYFIGFEYRHHRKSASYSSGC